LIQYKPLKNYREIPTHIKADGMHFGITMANINSTFEEIKRTYNLILYAESIGYQINKLASTKNIYSGKIIEMRLLDSSGSKIDEILVKYIDLLKCDW